MRQLSDFDRGRLTPGQRASLDAGNRALATLNESRTRLSKLAPLLATMQAGQNSEMRQRLVGATAAITPFDETVATPEQKEALGKARTSVKTLAWALLQDRVNSLAPGGTPQADEAAAAVYQLVKDTPAAELTGPQRALLAKGAAGPSLWRQATIVSTPCRSPPTSGGSVMARPIAALLPPGRRSRLTIASASRTATRRRGIRYRARRRSSVDPSSA
jgi:hypothetical protein